MNEQNKKTISSMKAKGMKRCGTLFRTDDYGMFHHHPVNRLDEGEQIVKPRPCIVDSMKKDGFWMHKPITVISRDDGNGYIVKDGHHRLESAKVLGIPVVVVVVEDDGKLPQEYIPEKNWTPLDLMRSYSKAGNPEYAKLERFVDEYGLPVRVSATLLCGGAGNMAGFRTGDFKVRHLKSVEQIADIVNGAIGFAPYAKSERCLMALWNMLKIDGFDGERMKKKLMTHGPSMLHKCPDIRGYVECLERIYNAYTKKSDRMAFSVYMS